jgi:hypothetical protein
MIALYLLATLALLVGTAAVYMALLKPFPVQWLYYHYFIRKPLVWTIFAGSLAYVTWLSVEAGTFPLAVSPPLALIGLAIVLTYRMHQESAFPAVDFPAVANDPFKLPLTDDMQMAVVEHSGVAKAYPLDYVIHHHIINDWFGDRIVALTYCAMCRSIIPFDVTDIGPLFVGSFKDANMIVADRRTKTFFQQATFQSIIGPLHPHTLTMIPFQILRWREIRRLKQVPQIWQVAHADFREFELPIAGVWRKIMLSETTPGLPSRLRDKSFPARTHVIGVTDPIANPQVAYLKSELMQQSIVHNEALSVFLVARGDTVNAFAGSVTGRPVQLSACPDGELADTHSGTIWDARGKYASGPIKSDLEKIAISDEYWFSWKAFHPSSRLIRIGIGGVSSYR